MAAAHQITDGDQDEGGVRFSHLPVIGDPSHATGKWYLVEPVGLAAIAAGADGLLVEVRPNPDHALSDGAQSLTPDNFAKLVHKTGLIAEALGRSLATQADAEQPARRRKAS